ncbi:response regulator transcription factor [Bombilactobacillus thymidiniphilus]|uniref:Response regulator transcription factor n=1 Tax=Bombilactobacillus thymidiniphilus TaxID=2923363 RepID=A0ABY4PCJ0_9LACO|nr:response regulator transcription factor [Bombilactobacillus thymidiniphilus]UQS83310.1 response regulator transcription factor [Bombilactobacillus thymidiniphilus]
MQKILVVDDETTIAELLRYNLEQNGFQVTVVNDGQKALDLLNQSHFDLVLLDLMLPKIDGLQITRQLRQQNNTIPIIMLTARANQMDKISGLEMGADDYVTKPFDIQELMARVKAILRRHRQSASAKSGLMIDHANFQVLLDGQPIALTKTQYKLFAYLYKHANQTLTRQQIMDYLWGTTPTTALDSRAVDIQISHLRDKLEKDPKHPQYLQTMRGFGYRLAI